MNYENSVIYQIYPLGFCGAPRENDGVLCHRIGKVKEWTEHIKGLGTDCVLFNPLFESDSHGYDTRDFFKIDCRLGDEQDFGEVCDTLHSAGMSIILDGVFNHVGRGFWAFRDVLEKKWDSPYKDWFKLSFDGNSPYNDGFWYEGWEGHFELVKLNLCNPDVKNHIFSAISYWIDKFGIDGLRLDVAYSLSQEFLAELRGFTESKKQGFALIGETLHGDYNRTMNSSACHSVTNYECYKGLYSSFNCGNMHEISYSLNRQFGSEPWCLYTGKHLLSFLDNHDVSRIATILADKNQLSAIYGLLFSMPGVPALYYGSEWGAEGDKKDGDASLRPCFEKPIKNELYDFISRLAHIHKNEKALIYGSYKNLFIMPKQLVFERICGGERILVAINSDASEANARLPIGQLSAFELISGENAVISDSITLTPYSVSYFKII